MKIQSWANELMGMDDYITAQSFDNAVMAYGIHVENELQRRWDNGEPMYSLSDILHGHEEKYVRAKNQAALNAIMGTPKKKGRRAAFIQSKNNG